MCCIPELGYISQNQEPSSRRMYVVKPRNTSGMVPVCIGRLPAHAEIPSS